MIDKDYLVGVFNNILPATFQNSKTYLEQLILLRDKVNEIIEIVNGITEGGGSGYVLPTASATVKGGIKVGERLSIDEEGVLSADVQGGGSGGVIEAKVEQTEDGARIVITDSEGTTEAEVKNGAEGPIGETGPKGPQGPTGATGADGFSPIAKVEQSGYGAVITITDKDGTTTATVQGGGGEGGSYTLPVATQQNLGGVKIGGNNNVIGNWADGTLQLHYGQGLVATNYIEGDPQVYLTVYLGEGMEFKNGLVSVKLGTGLYFDEEGRLCATGGGTEVVTTGITDEVSTNLSSESGSGVNETITQVSESATFTKF